MLHAKFQNRRPSGSGEEDFWRFLLFIAMTAILVCDLNLLHTFSFPYPKDTAYKNGFDWSSGYWEN